jgi:PST family polysaccharide transporter
MGDARVAPLLRWLSLIFLLNAASDMQIAVLRRRLQMKPLAQRTLVAQAVGGVVGVGMALAGYGVWALIGQTLSAALSGLIILWAMSEWRPGFRVSRRHFGDIFGYGFSVLGTNLLLFASARADRLLIGSLLGPVALGIYVVGFRAVRIVVELVTKILSLVALPVFSRMQDDLPRMRRAYFSALRSNGLLTFPAYGLLIALAPDVVPALFGEQWSAAVPVMQVLALLGLSDSMQLFTGPITNAMGKPQWLAFITGISAVIGIAGIALAAPYGIVMVAGVVALRGWILLPLRLELLRRLIAIPLSEVFRAYAVPGLASLTIGVAAHFFVQELAPQLVPVLRVSVAGAAGLLLYALLIRVFAPPLFAEIQGLMISLVPQRVRDRFARES